MISFTFCSCLPHVLTLLTGLFIPPACFIFKAQTFFCVLHQTWPLSMYIRERWQKCLDPRENFFYFYLWKQVSRYG